MSSLRVAFALSAGRSSSSKIGNVIVEVSSSILKLKPLRSSKPLTNLPPVDTAWGPGGKTSKSPKENSSPLPTSTTKPSAGGGLSKVKVIVVSVPSDSITVVVSASIDTVILSAGSGSGSGSGSLVTSSGVSKKLTDPEFCSGSIS